MILPTAAIALMSIANVSAVPGAESEVPVETYQLSDGTNCFLVPLQADAVESTSDYVDVAALVDFSAAQLSSDVRKATQETIDALVASLPENARVQLFAVSNETEPLTDGYLSVNSKELKDAVASLKNHDALGAADLEKSFSVAVDSFDYNESADRSIVFVGRGVSTGAAFNEDVFEETVEKLVDARIPVNSFGVGSYVNKTVLGALANRTGGYVVEEGTTAKDAGAELANAAVATVFFPEVDALAIGEAEVYPAPLPPIRSDRETYLVGSTSEELEALTITIPATVSDGREADVEWNVVPQKSDKSNQYLYQLVQEAAANNGSTLAVAGRALLTDRQVAANEAADENVELAKQAAQAGNEDAARRIANLVDVSFTIQDDEDEDEDSAVVVVVDEEDEIDGADEVVEEEAAVVVNEPKVAAPKAEAPKAEAPKAVSKAVADEDTDASDLFANARAKMAKQEQGNLMDAAESNVKVQTAQMKTAVNVAVQNAMKDARTNPEGAKQNIKTMIQTVRNNQILSDADRAVLCNELERTGMFVEQESEKQARQQLRAQQNQATVDAVNRAARGYQADQTKIVEIMKRFDSLIKEHKFVLASEAADEAAKIAVDNALPMQAANVALLRDAYEENQKLRFDRRRKLLNTLMSVERAHIPVSDEPPISYPDAEVWINMSNVRKEKYKTTNLQGSEEEQRIAKALDLKVDVNGGEDADLTLSDWIDEVKRTLREKGQDVNIVFDNTNIEEAAGPPSSLNIAENLSSITLRKALKIVLRPHELDFCILDDCLYITTQDEIKNNPDISTSLQLYSVGDLIMQPNQMGMSGGMGMMGGGGMGGMGGMGGGMGGGRGGMGGMGGGMGGGMWNIQPAARGHRTNNAQGANDSILQNFLDAPITPAGANDGLFAVPSKSAKNAKAAQVGSKAAGTLAKAPVDLNAKWDAYIAANAPKAPAEDASEDVVNAYEKARAEFSESIAVQVSKLLNSDAASAAALIKSALRNDFAANWMYEALAAALIKANAPQKEVEQAILSVADFDGDPLVLMGLAAYLEKVGSSERALKIYRDVARVFPTRPEPYVRGLALAQELNDEEALKWVALGIASIVWDGALVEDVQNKGEEIALDLVEKMKEEGREAEAADFEAKLVAARERDVVVEICWSGDAELDLSVQEPTNAVCWYMQKRTAAGGVLSDTSVDLKKSYDANREGMRTRVYSCPMGFSGDYNFLVTRSWGSVAQGKVTVNIKTNVGTEKERSATQVFTLEQDEALFTVNLAEGRRSEEVKEELLTASAIMNQMQVRTSKELAQRAAAYQSGKAHNEAREASKLQSKADEYQSSYKADTTVAADDTPQIEYVTPDPGHMPVIDYLDLGAGFTTSAGVSGDRRYVLLAPYPYFNQMLKMFTYNSSDGSSSSSGGNGGNNNSYGGGNNNNNRNGGGNNNSYGGGNNRNGGGMGGNSNRGGMGGGSSW